MSAQASNAVFTFSGVADLTGNPRLVSSALFASTGVAAISNHPRLDSQRMFSMSASAAISAHPRLEGSTTFNSSAIGAIAAHPRLVTNQSYPTTAPAFPLQLGPLAMKTAQAYATSATARMTGGADSGINLTVVAADALLCFGIAKASNAKTYVRDRIMADINAALQLIYGRAQYLGYFNRVERSYPLWTTWATATAYSTGDVVKESGLYYRCAADHTAGTFATDLAAVLWVLTVNPNSVNIETDVQEVEGLIREATTHRPLRPLASMSQLEMFGEAFLGTAINTTGTPIAAYVQRETTSVAADASIKVFVAPTPTNSFTMQLDVLLKAPRYTWTDVDAGTPLYLPHKYVESILLPIVRQRLSTSLYFVLQEKLGSIEAQAKTAMEQLGLVDPQAGPIKKQKTATEGPQPK